MLTAKNRFKSFGGWTEFHEHASQVCNGPMRFSVYLPPQIEKSAVPVLYWLSGLECSEENFMHKAGAQRYAAEHGVMIVAPDTSPRNTGLPVGEGAGFYVDAVTPNYSKRFQMYSYVSLELPKFIRSNFNVNDRQSISGHSMGGHGALMLSLRNPGQYRSVSAFAPIGVPSQAPWGQTAFTGYLGTDQKNWAQYDTSQLVGKAKQKTAFLVDQGSSDKFLKEQLMPEKLKAACEQADYPLDMRMREGYDHSYYFVASFIGEHIAYHAKALA